MILVMVRKCSASGELKRENKFVSLFLIGNKIIQIWGNSDHMYLIFEAPSLI